jgi:HD superfamily phosphodiesterase
MENLGRIEVLKKLTSQMCVETTTEKKDEYGLIHLSGVGYLSGYIAANRKLNVELCICAGFLHDLWLFRNMLSPDISVKYVDHGHYGSELAKKILTGTGLYGEDEIEIICRMISNHHKKEEIHDEYSEVLKDADALQHYLNNNDYDKKYKYHERIEKLI